jgi:hypothetical protein
MACLELAPVPVLKNAVLTRKRLSAWQLIWESVIGAGIRLIGVAALTAIEKRSRMLAGLPEVTVEEPADFPGFAVATSKNV